MCTPDEPADKLYNEGLFLLNDEARFKSGAQALRGSRPPASLFGMGAQVAADGGFASYQAQDTTTASSRRSAISRCIRAARRRPMRST